MGATPSPKFSVVIPLYNKVKSIRSTVESVLTQTFANFELLVVNDGSTDGSDDVVRTMKDPRIRLIDKPNGGVSSARNRGIAEAKGEWIALLDSDDFWLPEHLENFEKAITKNADTDVFFSGWTRERSRNFAPRKIVGMLKGETYFQATIIGVSLCGSCICFRQKLSSTMPMFDERLTNGEDLELWGRLVKTVGVFSLPQVTVVYRTAENMASSRIPAPWRTSVFFYDFSAMSPTEKRICENAYIGTGTLYLLSGHFSALRQLLSSTDEVTFALIKILLKAIFRAPRFYAGKLLGSYKKSQHKSK